MVTPAPLLAFGDFPRLEYSHLQQAAQSAALEVHQVDSAEEAYPWLDEHQPCALVLPQLGQRCLSFALQVRAQKKLARLPIVSLARELSDLEFLHAYSWGVDDLVIPRQLRSLTNRLHVFQRTSVQSEIPPRGVALVAKADQHQRILIARTLGNAGYDVRFAVTAEDAERFALSRDLSLVVLCAELTPDPLQLIDEAIQAGSPAHFIVSAHTTDELEQARLRRGRLETRIISTHTSPENIIFLANELSSFAPTNQRESPRHLYGTMVQFRNEGHEQDELGFSYNVSMGGLYVRTLAPPEEDTVWLELTPPRDVRRVRLVGQVVWRRPFGPPGHATVPPGFGVKIVDGGRADLTRWHESCARLGQFY